MLDQLGAVESYTGPTVAVLQAQIASLKDAERIRAALDEDTAKLRKLKREREESKTLEKEAKAAGDKLIAQVKSTAEATVNRYMPDGLRAAVDLDRNAWTVIDNKGKARSKRTMCGFENDSLVPALAAAYTEGSPLRVLVIDDKELAGFSWTGIVRFFDKLMEALNEGLLTHVFVAGQRLDPVLPQLEAQGWMVKWTDTPQPQLEDAPAPEAVLVPQPPDPNAPEEEGAYLPSGVPRL
jgi:hypothetical protein